MRHLFTLLCLWLFIAKAYAQPLPELIPYTNGDKWGYADTNGHIVLQPQWDAANFFTNGKAMVMINFQPGKGGGSPYTYCLIDKKGNYIIPPARHWTGEYTGWQGNLNARDDTGRWGMIDTLNQVLVPFEWNQTYSHLENDTAYKLVSRNGLYGVMDRNNKLVLPCRYGNITNCCGLAQINAFVVTDTGKGTNRSGVADVHNNLLLPMRYYMVSYLEKLTGKGFHVTQTVGEGYGNLQSKWIDLATGRETPVSDHYDYTGFIRQGNYLLYRDKAGNALYDTNRNLLIPCCSSIRIGRDTITLEEQQATDDEGAERVRITYFNAKTLQPYSAPRTITYAKPSDFFPQRGECGNGVMARNEYRKRYSELPDILVDGRYVKTFYKDSVRYDVQGYIDDDPFPYSRTKGAQAAWRPAMTTDLPQNVFGGHVTSYVLSSGSKQSDIYSNAGWYSVITTTDGRFMTGAQPGTIMSYNVADSLVATENGIYTTGGKALCVVKNTLFTGAFRWRKRLYTYRADSVNAHGNDSGYEFETFVLKLADDKGNIIPALAQYNIAGPYTVDGKVVALAVTDTAGMMGIVTPDGKAFCPAVNFKHRALNITADGLVLTRDSLNRNGRSVNMCSGGRITDIKGRELLPGKTCWMGAASNIPSAPSGYQLQPGAHIRPIPGLYLAVQKNSQSRNGEYYYYIDRHGRVYREGLMKKR